MPQRTNERQQIIEMLKSVLVGPNCTVTPSKMYPGIETGNPEREVDVVAEYLVDDDLYVQSFEVTSRKQRPGLPWAEQLIKKHESLPTDRLYLVSWNGFAKSVASLVAKHDWVRLVDVATVQDGIGPAAITLYSDLIKFHPKRTVAVVEYPSGKVVRVEIEHLDTDIVDGAGMSVNSFANIVGPMVADPEVGRRALEMAHTHPKREDLNTFLVGSDLSKAELYLKHESPDEFHHLLAIEVISAFTFSQEPLEMEVRTFADRYFAHGNAKVGDASGLVVVVLDDEFQVVKAGARMKLEIIPTFSAADSED